jgi:hypothetical protein
VSDTGKEVAFTTIETIRDQALHLKTKTEVAGASWTRARST